MHFLWALRWLVALSFAHSLTHWLSVGSPRNCKFIWNTTLTTTTMKEVGILFGFMHWHFLRTAIVVCGSVGVEFAFLKFTIKTMKTQQHQAKTTKKTHSSNNNNGRCDCNASLVPLCLLDSIDVYFMAINILSHTETLCSLCVLWIYRRIYVSSFANIQSLVNSIICLGIFKRMLSTSNTPSKVIRSAAICNSFAIPVTHTIASYHSLFPAEKIFSVGCSLLFGCLSCA